MRNYFPKRPSGVPLHSLSKLYDVPVGFVTPPPFFKAVYCFIYGRRRLPVARHRIICLVLENQLQCTQEGFISFDESLVLSINFLCYDFKQCGTTPNSIYFSVC